MVFRVFGGVFQLFGDMFRDDIMQKQIGLILHILHSHFVLIRHLVAVKAQSITDFEFSVEQKDENEYEHQIEADFKLVVLKPMCVAGVLDSQIYKKLLVKLLIDHFRNLAMIVADHQEECARDQSQNVLRPTVELNEVAKVNQAHEEQKSIIELYRRKFGDVDEGEIDEYRRDRQRDENAAEKVPRIVL